jgi:hypothetical protein
VAIIFKAPVNEPVRTHLSKGMYMTCYAKIAPMCITTKSRGQEGSTPLDTFLSNTQTRFGNESKPPGNVITLKGTMVLAFRRFPLADLKSRRGSRGVDLLSERNTLRTWTNFNWPLEIKARRAKYSEQSE